MATKKNDLSNWARNLIVKGLDNVAGALEPADDAATDAPATPLHRLADHWRTLTAEERETIATRIIAGAGSALATLPVIAGAKRAAKPAPRRPARPAATAAAAAAAKPIEIPIDEKKKDKKKKKEKGGKDKKSRKEKKDKREKKKAKKKK